LQIVILSSIITILSSIPDVGASDVALASQNGTDKTAGLAQVSKEQISAFQIYNLKTRVDYFWLRFTELNQLLGSSFRV
jgi:hypothetical protein